MTGQTEDASRQKLRETLLALADELLHSEGFQKRLAEAAARRSSEQQPSTPTRDQVLVARLAGQSLAEIAARYGVSERTIHRRLADADAST